MPIKSSRLKLREGNLDFVMLFLSPFLLTIVEKHRGVFCFDNGFLVLKEADGKVLLSETKV